MTITEGFDEATTEFLLSPAGRMALEELRHEELAPAQTLAHSPGCGGNLRRTPSRRRARSGGTCASRRSRNFPPPRPCSLRRRPCNRRLPSRSRSTGPPNRRLGAPRAVAGPGLRHRRRFAGAWRRCGPYRLRARPVRARFARANAAALGLGDRVEVRQSRLAGGFRGGRLAGGRRSLRRSRPPPGGRRLFSLAALEPPLADLMALQAQVPLLVVKVMPGVDLEEVPPGWKSSSSATKGVQGGRALERGRGRDGFPGARWATVYDGVGWEELAATADRLPVGDLAPGAILYEPDFRSDPAGAVPPSACAWAPICLDPQIAYLVAPTLRFEPLAQAFVVDEIHPIQPQAPEPASAAVGDRPGRAQEARVPGGTRTIAPLFAACGRRTRRCDIVYTPWGRAPDDPGAPAVWR